jgi:hypothetical protein
MKEHFHFVKSQCEKIIKYVSRCKSHNRVKSVIQLGVIDFSISLIKNVPKNYYQSASILFLLSRLLGRLFLHSKFAQNMSNKIRWHSHRRNVYRNLFLFQILLVLTSTNYSNLWTNHWLSSTASLYQWTFSLFILAISWTQTPIVSI